MEAASEPQHRTRVNSIAGRIVWVSAPRSATPNIQPWRYGTRSGSGGKEHGLTPGDLHGSSMRGRDIGDDDVTTVEKSDRPIVALKLGNAGGAKGTTG